MKVSGFTLVRNGTKFDYPYLESMRSLLPIVDELIINVDKGDDDTVHRVAKFCLDEGKGKAVYFESDWGWGVPEKMRSGLILSEQTNLALDRCTGDWCVYLQADEVLHENDASRLRAAMRRCFVLNEVQGLLFDYVHFYGSYDVVQRTRSAYRREVRAFKRSSGARSVGDAQSFRLPGGAKLPVVESGAKVYHYGWVRPPEAMREKTFHMDQLYHGSTETSAGNPSAPHSGDNYRYKKFWGLKPYHEGHPVVMRERIERKNWKWDLASSPMVFKPADVKKVVLDSVEKLTGKRLFEYRSYRKIAVREDLRPAVVITTYNNPRLLGICLRAFAAQSCREFDVFIADDGSKPETKSKIDELRPRFSGKVEHFWHPDTGYKKATIGNQVFRAIADYPLVICVDHDTVAHRKFIEDHVRAHQGRFKLLFMGRRINLGPKVTASLTEKNVERLRSGFSAKLLRSAVSGETKTYFRSFRIGWRGLRRALGRDQVNDLLGSNFSITTELLYEVNGYNEDYQAYWGEDGDLFVRARNSGATLLGSKSIAIQFHMHHPTLAPSREHQQEYQRKLATSDYRRCENGIFKDGSAPPAR